ncbi:MAG: hypothetical protein WC455_12655 [Dehalococcoidia bacterium]|jgi:hypothetical protein
MDDGPAPLTDHDYLIKIYERQGYQSKDIKTLCDAIHDHENRITALEKADACLNSYEQGKTSWWESYKEPILIIFSLITGSIITVLLSLLGVHQ